MASDGIFAAIFFVINKFVSFVSLIRLDLWLTILWFADNAGTNKAASSGTSLNTKRLDDDTENLAHERVPSDLKKNLMQARLDKKMTQAQLAQMINEKPQVIQEYESGKAIPNQQIISKLERALGTKLRGKK